jgi:hypothetical protein
MTKRQLEDLVNGTKKPNLLESEVKLLLNKEDAYIKSIPKPQPVAQLRPQPVAQPKPQPVAQVKPKVVAQEVAQVTWVAQEVAKVVAQPKPKPVAQNRPQVVAQTKPKPVAQKRPQFTSPRVKDSEELLIDKDVNELKDQIFQIEGVEERKKFIKDIGWGVMGEKRGKKYYLFGAKKISGRKYKLYIGNATS